jgi:threonine 3-dehydrogenase
LSDTMKAVVKTRPELGAELQEVAIPRPKKDEVLLKVNATSICGTDIHIYKWDDWSAKRIGAENLPRILGHEVAGEVVEIGADVSRIAVGDHVSVETHIPKTGDLQTLLNQQHIGENMEIVSLDTQGCWAEYFAIKESVCWKNDPTIPYELACIQEPLGNAVYATLGEDADVAGKSMAIVGDGPVALFSVGVARAAGVTNIFLIGMADELLKIGKEMGADHVLNVLDSSIDPAQYVLDHTEGFGTDIVLDMAGNEKAVNLCLKVVRKGGRFSAFGVSPTEQMSITYNDGIVFKGLRIDGINGRRMFDTWYRVRNFLASGRLDVRPVITDILMLDDYEKGFERLLAKERSSAKVVMFADESEYNKAIARQK